MLWLSLCGSLRYTCTQLTRRTNCRWLAPHAPQGSPSSDMMTCAGAGGPYGNGGGTTFPPDGFGAGHAAIPADESFESEFAGTFGERCAD